MLLEKVMAKNSKYLGDLNGLNGCIYGIGIKFQIFQNRYRLILIKYLFWTEIVNQLLAIAKLNSN
jgi:hypothetical protein